MTAPRSRLFALSLAFLSVHAAAQSDGSAPKGTEGAQYEFRVKQRGMAVSTGAPAPAPVPSPAPAPAPAPTKLAGLSSGSIVFDAQPLGGSQTKDVLLTNNGTGSVTLEAPQVQGTAFSATTSCGTTLAASQSCVVSVTFSAASYAAQSGTLTVGSDATNGPLTATLNGTTLPETDPFFSQVERLLHMDGVDGGSTFSDVKGGAVSAIGTVTTSATQSKFGGTSAQFTGAGALSTSSSAMTGSWTIEFWVYPTSSSTQVTLVSFFGTGQRGINFWRNPSHQLVIDNGVNSTVPFTGGTLPTGQWSHVAAVRNGTVTTAYINGSPVGSNSFSPLASSTMLVGRLNAVPSVDFRGYIDDFRLTLAPRYTGAFTPPATPAPNN